MNENREANAPQSGQEKKEMHFQELQADSEGKLHLS